MESNFEIADRVSKQHFIKCLVQLFWKLFATQKINSFSKWSGIHFNERLNGFHSGQTNEKCIPKFSIYLSCCIECETCCKNKHSINTNAFYIIKITKQFSVSQLTLNSIHFKLRLEANIWRIFVEIERYNRQRERETKMSIENLLSFFFFVEVSFVPSYIFNEIRDSNPYFESDASIMFVIMS